MDRFFQPAPGGKTASELAVDAKEAQEKAKLRAAEASKARTARTAKAKAEAEKAKGSMTRIIKGERAKDQPLEAKSGAQLVHREAADFLERHGPPWWGDSDFEHVKKIKELCCKGAEEPAWKARCFRGRKKAERTGNPEIDTPRWGTKDIVSLGHLLRSGIWTPLNGPTNPLAFQALVKEVGARANALEKERAAAAEKAAQKHEQKQQQQKPEGAAVSTVLNAEQRREKEKERAQEDAQLESTPEDLDRLAALGMDPQLVANTISIGDFSSHIEPLGPATGISTADRIIRVMNFQRVRVRISHPEIYFDAKKLEPLYLASDRFVVDELIRFVQDPDRVKWQMQEEAKVRKKAKDKMESVQQAEVLAEQEPTAGAEEMEVITGVEAMEVAPEEEEQPKKEKSRKKAKHTTTTTTAPLAERLPVNCGECLQVVHVQFLECFCSMQSGFGTWKICSECGDIVHPLRRVTPECVCAQSAA